MSKIRSRDTKPENLVRKYLFANGLRYKKNDGTLPGKPDVVLPKYKAVVFINGCFWHGHNCKAASLPSTNSEFWEKKIGANIKRDKVKILELRKMGWRVFVVWQCKIKNNRLTEKTLMGLVNKIVQPR